MQKDIITKILPTKLYRLTELADHGFILNTKGQPDRRYAYALIKKGKLPAKNMSMSKKWPLYMVRGSDLITFIKKFYF